MLYYSCLSIFFLLGIIKNEVIENKKSTFLIFLIIFLFCFSYQMGIDWISYQDLYENIALRLSWNQIITQYTGSERGYVILNLFFYKLGFNYEIFMGLILGICSFIVLNFIKKKSKNYYLAFYFFLIIFFLSALLEPLVRQVIALTFFIVGIKYIERKNFFKYVLIIILAAQFHRTAYLLIPLYFIKNLKFSMKKIILIVFSFKILLDYILILILYIFPKYSVYLKEIKYMSKGGTSLITIIMSCYYLYVEFYAYKFSRNYQNYILNFACLYVIIDLVTAYFPILGRMNLYFAPFISIAISYIGSLYYIDKRKIRLLKGRINNVFLVIISFIMATIIFYRRVAMNELASFGYLNYKNYIIEFIKGDLKKNFLEKSQEYKEKFDELLEKEIL
ncbi:EpsG family protein [Fusobacterium pseudoperiodonticum]